MRVAIVDDEIIFRKQIEQALTEILDNQIYTIDKFESGDELISSKGKYDIVLMDIEMPGINGIYVLRKLRMDARFNQCPVVMLTGNKTRETVVECIQCGAQGYLTKPVTPLSLKLRLRQYLGGVQG